MDGENTNVNPSEKTDVKESDKVLTAGNAAEPEKKLVKEKKSTSLETEVAQLKGCVRFLASKVPNGIQELDEIFPGLF